MATLLIRRECVWATFGSPGGLGLASSLRLSMALDRDATDGGSRGTGAEAADMPHKFRTLVDDTQLGADLSDLQAAE